MSRTHLDKQHAVRILREGIRYDPILGTFKRVKPSCLEDRNGNVVGRLIRLRGVVVTKAQAAWILQTGAFPPDGNIVGFRNGDSSDWRFTNLYLTTSSAYKVGYKRNRPQSHLPTGVYEVRKPDGTVRSYRAVMRVNYKAYQIGAFDTVDAAGSARQRATEHFKNTGNIIMFRGKGKRVLEIELA